MSEKFDLQDAQYRFPYHHLVNLGRFDNHKVLTWGLSYYAYMKKIFDLLQASQPGSLLDVGCGDGKLLSEVAAASSGRRLAGIDLSERAITLARGFNYGNGVQFFCQPLSQLPDKYDAITLVQTLEHIPDGEVSGFIGEVCDHLNPGGRLIVSVPTTNLPVSPKHFRHYTEEALQKDFSKLQLQSTHYLLKKSGFYNFLERLLGKLSGFSSARGLIFRLAKRFYFSADKKNATQIICVFEKKN